ncbi:MAG: hypothetical protein ABI779_27920 [Acidobacteriota bacterium]
MNDQTRSETGIEAQDGAVRAVANTFAEAGWSVEEPATADLLVSRSDQAYLVEVKFASEGRTDRLVPLLSQAVLQVRRHSEGVRASPLVVLVSKEIRPRVVENLKRFHRTYAADVAIGFMDSRNLREFVGAGLETLSSAAVQPRSKGPEPKSVDLFSDLNQWLLKVLLAADLADAGLLNAPASRYRNATELARDAGVSVMTAFRFAENLKALGHLHESSPVLRLVRLRELMERWQAAATRSVTSISAKWVFAGERQSQIERLSRALGEDACLGFYAAADALGLGIVKGVPTHFYVREVPAEMGRLGIIRAAGSDAELILRVPKAKEGVFRAAVTTGVTRTCDVVQAWLDVSHDPSRGHEQAQYLYRKVIGPMIERANQW